MTARRSAALVQDLNCWTRKKRRSHVDREQSVEILDRRVLDRRRSGHAGVRDKDIKAVADDLARPLRRLVGSSGCGEIGGDSIGAAATFPGRCDDGFRFLRAVSVMDEHLKPAPALTSAKALARPMPREGRR